MNSFQFFKNLFSQARAFAPRFSAASALLIGMFALGLATRAQEQPAHDPATPEPPTQDADQRTDTIPSARLTLKSAVSQALQSSREVALARLQASVAEKSAGITRARFMPNLYTGSGIAYSNGFPQTPGGAAPSLFNLSYIQTVFNPPLRGELRAAQTRTDIQRLEADRVRDNVIVSTASTYFELANVRHALALLRKERSSATRIMDLTRDRVVAGLELPIELTRSELSAARVEQQNLRFEGREDVLEAQLRDLCGLAPDRRVILADQPEMLPALPAAGQADQPLPELVSLGIASSIELKQAQLEYQARQQHLHGERGGYWPTVDVVGEYSLLSKINNYDKFFKRFQRNNLNLGLQITVPIYSANTRAAVDFARANLSAAELQVRSRRTQVENDVRREARYTRELESGREVARLELKLAQEDLRVLQARFDEGRAGLRDMEKLRLEETTRWLAYIDADFEYQKARLELLRQTGQLASILQ
ncbi:MAG: TolC family protein [Acidipila sp.]|nr:TolC family protein [Acidipila sp.]